MPSALLCPVVAVSLEIPQHNDSHNDFFVWDQCAPNLHFSLLDQVFSDHLGLHT